MNTRRASVPDEVTARLKGKDLAFPVDWTLDQVAEESHRAFLAKRWGAPVEAMMAVTLWALSKLAAHPGFTAEHWKWIITPSSFGDDGVATRLAAIVMPATGYSHSWRSSSSQREDLLKEIDRLAGELLDLMRGSPSLHIGLREVVGFEPSLQPLLDESTRLEQRRRSVVQASIRDGHLSRSEAFMAMLGTALNPSLTDYLLALRAKLAGSLVPGKPSSSVFEMPSGFETDVAHDDEWGEDDEEKSSEEEDAEWNAITKEFGLEEARDPTRLLDSGGNFGSYPNRGSALRRAVINAVPRAVLEREEPEPRVTLAAFIEECCIAWFGSSPTQKEINTQIKDQRRELMEEAAAKAAVLKNIAGVEDSVLQKLRSAGVLSDEMRKFLDLE